MVGWSNFLKVCAKKKDQIIVKIRATEPKMTLKLGFQVLECQVP